MKKKTREKKKKMKKLYKCSDSYPLTPIKTRMETKNIVLLFFF